MYEEGNFNEYRPSLWNIFRDKIQTGLNAVLRIVTSDLKLVNKGSQLSRFCATKKYPSKEFCFKITLEDYARLNCFGKSGARTNINILHFYILVWR